MLKLISQFSRILPVRFWHDRVPEIEVSISEHSVFPSVYIQVRHEEPGNYTIWFHYPEIFLYLPNLALVSNFGFKRIAFHLLVVSTFSRLASKHFHSLLLPALHHSRSARIITYHGNTCCPHHLWSLLSPHSLTTLMIFGRQLRYGCPWVCWYAWVLNTVFGISAWDIFCSPVVVFDLSLPVFIDGVQPLQTFSLCATYI